MDINLFLNSYFYYSSLIFHVVFGCVGLMWLMLFITARIADSAVKYFNVHKAIIAFMWDKRNKS